MQNELISSVNGDPFRSTREEAKEEQPPLSSIHLPSNSGDLFYSSPSSLSLSPSPVSTNGGDDPAATEIRLHLALQYQYREKDTDRYEHGLSHLQEATEQTGNGHLTSRSAMQLRPETSFTSVLPLQPLNENQMLRHAAERRTVLPKSTSIRSSGYLKMNRPEPQGPASQLNDMTCGTRPVIPGSDKWRNINVMASGSGSREKVMVSNRKSRPNPKHEDGDNIDDMAISMELAADMDDDIVDVMPLMSFEPSQIAPDLKKDLLRYEHGLSHLQEATEQTGNGDLTSRSAMQLRPETSFTSVLPLQPLNENQLLHNAAERQAVPAPKGLASQLNDVTSSVRPDPTSRKNRVAIGAIMIFVILLCISEAKATLSFDAPAQSKCHRRVCSSPNWPHWLNNTGMDVFSYIVLLFGYLFNWYIMMRYEVKERGQSWMYLGCLFLSCIPLFLIPFDDDYRHWDIIKIWTGVVASTCTILLDIGRYAHFGHIWVSVFLSIGAFICGVVVQIKKERAAYIAQLVDVVTNLLSSLIMLVCLLCIKNWEYVTPEVFYAFISAGYLVFGFFKTCDLDVMVLISIAFITRILYGFLLCCRSTTAGIGSRVQKPWKPVWQKMKEVPKSLSSDFIRAAYFCCVVAAYVWSKFYTWIQLKMKSCHRNVKWKITTWKEQIRRPAVQQPRGGEVELTPVRVRQPQGEGRN